MIDESLMSKLSFKYENLHFGSLPMFEKFQLDDIFSWAWNKSDD